MLLVQGKQIHISLIGIIFTQFSRFSEILVIIAYPINILFHWTAADLYLLLLWPTQCSRMYVLFTPNSESHTHQSLRSSVFVIPVFLRPVWLICYKALSISNYKSSPKFVCSPCLVICRATNPNIIQTLSNHHQPLPVGYSSKEWTSKQQCQSSSPYHKFPCCNQTIWQNGCAWIWRHCILRDFTCWDNWSSVTASRCGVCSGYFWLSLGKWRGWTCNCLREVS